MLPGNLHESYAVWLRRDCDACYVGCDISWCAHVTAGLFRCSEFALNYTLPSTSISLDARCAIQTHKCLPTYHLLLLPALLNHLHEGQLPLSCKDTPQEAHRWTVPPVEHLQALGPHQDLNKSQWIYSLMMAHFLNVSRGCKRFGVVSRTVCPILRAVTDVRGPTWRI